jgi:hypothetical protein
MPLPEERFSASTPDGKFLATPPVRRRFTRALVFTGIAVVLGLGISGVIFLAQGAFGIHDSPVDIGGGSIYADVGALHFFHEDRKHIHYHAGRNFKSDSRILLTCVIYPPNSPVQQEVTVPIQDATSWNVFVSTQDAQGNEKEKAASACSNQDCNINTPPDPNGNIYISAADNSTGSSDSPTGWNRSTFGGELDYFDNSTGCMATSSGAGTTCDHLTYLTVELPSGSTKYGCDGGKCQVYMGGPKSTNPNPNPPVCP